MYDTNDHALDRQILSLINDPLRRDEGFHLLIKTYKERIYWVVRRIVKNHEDADDVVQETFIKVYKAIENFKEDSQLYTWMYRIAVNEALTHLRKLNSKSGVTVPLIITEHIIRADEQDGPTGDQIAALLNMAIDQLPEKQKAVFNLRYFEEMKYQDMSEILKTSEGGLKALYHHAVKKIEAFIKQNGQ